MKNELTLTIRNLHISLDDKEILKGISLTVKTGQIHAVMGPNGSGKSTLAYALMGHPGYAVLRNDQIRPIRPIRPIKAKTTGVWLNKTNILELPTEERARRGLFLALQAPIAIPGVSVVNLLRTAYQSIYQGVSRKTKKDRLIQNPALARRWETPGLTLSEFTNKLAEYARILHLDESYLVRGIHDGFSGGEKKKLEMLQALMLRPKIAIFDEIDTGLDVDALKTVAAAIQALAKKGTGVIVVTHYQRILKYLKPDVVHVLVGGKIVKSGKAMLAKQIEDKGYTRYTS